MTVALYTTRIRDTVTLEVWNYYAGEQSDATSVVLRDAAGTAGIVDDLNNVVVPPGTPFKHVGVGHYMYTFTAPDLARTYTAHVEVTQPNGRIDRTTHTFGVPGILDPAAPYITASDLRTGVTWIDDLLDSGHGQTDFDAQLRAAREELDAAIIARCPSSERAHVQRWLQSGGLVVTPQVVMHQRAAALALILRGAIGEPGDKFERMAEYYERRARHVLARLHVYLDIDGDGVPDKEVDMQRIVAGRY